MGYCKSAENADRKTSRKTTLGNTGVGDRIKLK
jgi:hypothetical protein